MTKKSAAGYKIADNAKKNLPPIEDVFETQRKGMLATIDIQIKQDSRFDTLLSIRESNRRFYGDDSLSIDGAMAMAAKIKGIHEEIKEIMETMTIGQMSAEEFENPCDKLVAFDEPKCWDAVFEQSIIFSAVQPYGQAFDDLHGRMIEEAAKRA